MIEIDRVISREFEDLENIDIDGIDYIIGNANEDFLNDKGLIEFIKSEKILVPAHGIYLDGLRNKRLININRKKINKRTKTINTVLK